MKMMDVTYESYGRYESPNYGVHCLKFTDAWGNKYWFSYTTLVAFNIGGEFHIKKNTWGTTTGKHLNWIDPDKTIREDDDLFIQNYIRCSDEFRKRRAN